MTAPGVGAITACRSLRSSTSLKERSRDETIDRLRTKVCELTVETKLLQAKTERLEAGAAGTDADADLGATIGQALVSSPFTAKATARSALDLFPGH